MRKSKAPPQTDGVFDFEDIGEQHWSHGCINVFSFAHTEDSFENGKVNQRERQYGNRRLLFCCRNERCTRMPSGLRHMEFLAGQINIGMEGTDMDKSRQEKMQQQKNHDEFNSITQKVKPENQNQEHNVREEGIHPINRKR